MAIRHTPGTATQAWAGAPRRRRRARQAYASREPYRAAALASVRVPVCAGCWVACEVIPNDKRSHSEAVCPGNVANEHNWAAEFVPVTSCVANGMAATQPVWLSRARIASVKRGVTAESPLRRWLPAGGFSPAQCRLSKGLAPHRFSEGSGADQKVDPRRLAKG
jgi:hypothetical protein